MLSRICSILFASAITASVAAVAVHGQAPVAAPATKSAVGQWDAAVVRRAAALLDTPAKWNRADNAACPKNATTFSIMCALQKAVDDAVAAEASPTAVTDCVFHSAGAGQEGSCGDLFDELPILTVSRVPAVTTGKWRADAQPIEVWTGTMSAIEQPVLEEARQAPVVNGKGYKARLVDYNNDPSTTFEDVKKYFKWLEDMVAASGPADLAQSFDNVEIEIYKDGKGVIRTYNGWYPISHVPTGNALRFQMDRLNQVPPNDLDRQILKRAAALFTSEAMWNRADDRKCPATATTLSIYCAEERASIEVTGGFHHRRPALELVRNVVDERSKGKSYDHRLMDYNNDPSTTLADVRSLFAAALARVK